jgi:hypothetical protein
MCIAVRAFAGVALQSETHHIHQGLKGQNQFYP